MSEELKRYKVTSGKRVETVDAATVETDGEEFVFKDALGEEGFRCPRRGTVYKRVDNEEPPTDFFVG
jgi:hypothetical protein